MNRTSSLLAVYVVLHGVNAFGDGTSVTVACQGSDDTAAFSTALNSVCGVGGGEVIIPPGTCLLSTAGLPLSLCSKLTIRGVGRKSLVKVVPGSYTAIFASPGTDTLSNVVFKDFAVDQSPSVPVGAGSELLHVIDIRPAVVGNAHGVSGMTVSGMFFDPIDGAHTIHLENDGVVTTTNDGNLRATITNNYFNFVKTGGSAYANSAVYLEGSQQVVTGNTFLSTLGQFAGTAVETRGGRSSVSNNTSNNYATFANVVPSSQTFALGLSPNNVVVANNSITCAQNGIALTGLSGRTIQNVSIAGNAIQVCNGMRFAFTSPPNFAGILWNGTAGDLDSLVVSNNIIAMDAQTQAPGYSGFGANNGGILLYTPGNLFNVLVTGNIVTSSPFSGIRVGSASTSTAPPVQRVRVNDNVIVDAGNDGAISPPNTDVVYRHAIGLWGTAREVDLMRNMIYDTGSTAANGLYSLYLNQTATPPSTNIRASQNTVRVAASSGALRAFQVANAGLVDATNANDVLITPTVGSGGSQVVDFMSFTRYITTISGNSPSQLTLNVPSPQYDQSNPPTYLNWTVGQLVTFRFRCANSNTTGGCLVTFDSSAYSLNPDPADVNLPIPSLYGRGITFAVETFSTGVKRFFELYRTPPQGVAN